MPIIRESPPPERGLPLQHQDFPHPPPAPHNPFRIDIISIYLFLVVIILSFAIEISGRFRKTEQRASRAETDKANAELSFLKAQINPHFQTLIAYTRLDLVCPTHLQRQGGPQRTILGAPTCGMNGWSILVECPLYSRLPPVKWMENSKV